MRNVVASIVLTVLTLPAILVLLLGALFRRPEAFLAYGVWMMRVGQRLLGIKVEAEGRDRLDRRTPYVFMCNHLSFLDAPALVTVIDRPVRSIVKRFVFRIPVFGWGMRLAGFVPVDKEGIGEGRKRIARASGLIREKGYSFLVFPEGQRSWDGRLQPFRRGGFFLALEAGAPIVPVSIAGTFELMPRVSRRVRRGHVRIVFHEPIAAAGFSPETLPELMERVRAAIASGLTS
ncbi:MAG: lysophospholipid acyltransferase family protein [Candidatus Aminicenantes bacterium]|nr:lysophospholipid acyltransferase family protein [Candidatus Aminicenantes bacterium]